MRRVRARALRRAGAVVWLWLLWLALWGSTGALAVTGGLMVAVAVVLAFRLPPVSPRVTVRPVRLALLLGRLAVDITGSAVAVGWAAVRHGKRVPAAVIEVPLAVDSDLLITVVSQLTTMTPGSLVLEIDRGQRLLYVHTLPVGDPREAERRRRAVQRAEREVALALGRADAVRAVRAAQAERAEPGGRGEGEREA